MRKLVVGLIAIAVSALGIVGGVTFAVDPPSSWLSGADPTLQKTTDLADNVPPAQSNLNCADVTVRPLLSSNMVNTCAVEMPLGLASDQGVVLTGSSVMTPVTPPAPFTGLNPIPNQSMFYTYTSSPVVGMYMGFYRSILSKMKLSPDFIYGVHKYVLTQGPDFILTNFAGKSQPVNPSALAFSPNGDWMVVDLPFQGFVRVNMATFDMVQFAPSMNSGSDYASYTAQLTISNDGRFVAIKPSNAPTFRVYDISTCQTSPSLSQSATCKSRDYWPYLTAQLPGLKALYTPRFTSDMQLSVTAQYEYSGAGYKVAKYALTAPGENPLGIEYLGMGDSYASGQGAFNYIAGTDTENNACHVSSLSYPFLLSANLFNSGHSVACSGAKTTDIIGSSDQYRGQVNDGIKKKDRPNQQEILSNFMPGYLLQNDFVDTYNPQNITLSIAGNDIGFADIVKRCVGPGTCYSTKEDQQELANRIQNMQPILQTVYRSISSPTRHVYVIGYPQIVAPGGNCAANVHLDEQEISLFIDLTNTLNATIEKAAAAAGVQYVDVSDAFAGHRMCETKSSDVAMNGLTAGTDTGAGFVKVIGAESYHPNVLGHELLRRAILAKTNNFKIYAKTPSVPESSSALPHADAPATNRTINVTITDDAIAADEITPLAPLSLQVDESTAVLKPSSAFTVQLDTSPVTIGTGATDTAGILNGTATVPADVSCGSHTLHIFGQNFSGQPVDIYKEVYVGSDTNCQNVQSSCGIVSDAGMDVDKDGIDDACDPLISDAPPVQSYKVYLTGSSIHVTQNQDNPQPAAPVADSPLPVKDVAAINPQDSRQQTHAAFSNYMTLVVVVVIGALSCRLYMRIGKY